MGTLITSLEYQKPITLNVATPAFTVIGTQDVSDTGGSTTVVLNLSQAVPARTTRLVVVNSTLVSSAISAITINASGTPSLSKVVESNITNIRDLTIWDIDQTAIGGNALTITYGGTQTLSFTRVFAVSGTSGAAKATYTENNSNASVASPFSLTGFSGSYIKAGNLIFAGAGNLVTAPDLNVTGTEGPNGTTSHETLSSVSFNRYSICDWVIQSASGSFGFTMSYPGSGSQIPGFCAVVYGP